MSIGSAPEIGTTFDRWGNMDEASQAAWFKFMQEEWGPDLMGGYGTLLYPPRDAGIKD